MKWIIGNFRIYKIVVYEVRNAQDGGIDTLNSLQEAKERIKVLEDEGDNKNDNIFL